MYRVSYANAFLSHLPHVDHICLVEVRLQYDVSSDSLQHCCITVSADCVGILSTFLLRELLLNFFYTLTPFFLYYSILYIFL